MSTTSRRRLLQGSLTLAGLGLLAGCGLVSLPGQRPTRLRRIGFLESGTGTPTVETLREALRELGYVEGQNLLIEYRTAEGHLELLPSLVAELVDLRVEIIVARENPAFLAASRVTSAIPIVASGGNVVLAGLVTNIARPEGNVTGVTSNSSGAAGKWIELLRERAPTISRLAAVLDRSGPWGRGVSLSEVQRAAQIFQLQLTLYDLRDLDQLSEILATVKGDGMDGLVVVSGGVLGGAANPRIGGEVLKSRLPAVAESRAFAANGGLLASGADPFAMARQAASYVDKLLKGARPGDLPIELPSRFNVVVNLRTARDLGITIPTSVLQQATEIIQ